MKISWLRSYSRRRYQYIIAFAILISGALIQIHQYWWGLEIERCVRSHGKAFISRRDILPEQLNSEFACKWFEPLQPVTGVLYVWSNAGRELKTLRWSPSLNRLAFSSATDEGWGEISKLTQLRELSVKDSVPPIGVEAVKKLFRLKSLRLWVHPDNSNCILAKELLQMPRLEEISFAHSTQEPALDRERCNESMNRTLRILAGLSTLRKIEFCDCYDSYLFALSERGSGRENPFPNLSVINVDGGIITKAGIDCLGKFPDLVELQLSNLNADDSCLKSLRGFAGLQSLAINGCVNVTDQSVMVIVQLTHLKVLNVRGTNITACGVKQLSALRNLKVLMVNEHQYDETLKEQFSTNCEIEIPKFYSTSSPL